MFVWLSVSGSASDGFCPHCVFNFQVLYFDFKKCGFGLIARRFWLVVVNNDQSRF